MMLTLSLGEANSKEEVWGRFAVKDLQSREEAWSQVGATDSIAIRKGRGGQEGSTKGAALIIWGFQKEIGREGQKQE